MASNLQNIFFARSPIFIYTNVSNGTLDSAFAEIRITPGGGQRRGNFGNDPITYTLQAKGTNNVVFFEISELIRDFISLNFTNASNLVTPTNANLSGGFFRFPDSPLYALVDVRFKRTVNGTQQSYFTDTATGKLVTLGYTSYEYGIQYLNGNSGSVGVPTFYKRLDVNPGSFPQTINWQLYQTPDRPLIASKKFIKPIWAPVEFMAARPYDANLGGASGSQRDSFYMTFKDGNIGAIIRNIKTNQNQTGQQLQMNRLGYYFNQNNKGNNIKEFSRYPQYTDLADSRFQYLYTDSEQLRKYLDSDENNYNEVDKLYYTQDYSDVIDEVEDLKDCYEVENRTCYGYTPMKIIFLNRYGVYEILWYFKNHKESINVKSTKFKRNILDISTAIGDTVAPHYERQNHQNFILDKTATKTIVLNSDWYPEEKNNSFEDLILSTHVWLEWNSQCFPVNVKDTKFTHKNSKTDGLINHQLTVEIATDYINSIS